MRNSALSGDIIDAFELNFKGIDMEMDADGNIYILGKIISDLESSRMLISKFDSEFTLLNNIGIGHLPEIQILDIGLLNENAIIAAGQSNPSVAADTIINIILMKFSNTLDPMWSKYSDIERIYSSNKIEIIDDENFLILGDTYGDIFLASFDSSGTLGFSKTYNSDFISENDYEKSFSVSIQESGYGITGSKANYGIKKSIYAIKTDEFGNSCCGRESEFHVDDLEIETFPVEISIGEFTAEAIDTEFSIMEIEPETISLCPR